MSKNSQKMESDGCSQQPTSSIPNEDRFLNYESFNQFYESFSANIKETVAASSKLGLKESDLEYFLAFPSFQEFIKTQNDRILRLMGQVLKNQNVKKSNFNSTKLDDEEKMDLLTDINDQLIEKLGIKLDELQGLRKKTETEMKLSVTTLNTTSRNINTSWNKDAGMVVNKDQAKNLQQATNRITSTTSEIIYSQCSNKKGNLQKSQLLFKDKIDNSHLPFVPKITTKPNALVPLPEVFQKITQLEFEISHEVFQQNSELLENPYAYEIEQVFLTDDDLKMVDEENSKLITIDNASFKFIDTLEDLKWLCEHLGKENRSKIKEIAVDLEHHSYRSFLGFTCLMQISTRDEDFLIDTLKLRSDMNILNEIFTDWTLLKVLHGSDFDIEWLQKDFGIYVVNMFDTGQAARQLLYPHFSLSYLLQKFCKISAQKQYQLADWRVRPLSQGMIKYAREDTRYLLFIYDRLKNELIKQSIDKDISLTSLNQVLEKSKQICKKVYKKPLFYSKGFLNLCQINSHLNAKQMKALQDLYTWRDKIAREHDESCEFVLKNHQLLKIAELLPREIYGILALCNPISSIVETNIHEIHEIIKKAREFTGTLSSLDICQPESESATKPDFNESKILESIVHSVTYDPNSILNCPHDFPHQTQKSESMDTEQITDLETVNKSNLNAFLIRPTERSILLPNEFKSKPATSLDKYFDKKVYNEKLDKRMKKIEEKVKEIKKQIRSPFEMFLPKYYQIGYSIEHNQYWNLIKSNQVKKIELEKELEPVQQAKTDDVLMIPLKKQFKHENRNAESKKLKRKLKDVDFTEAIIEYNKKKNEQIEALGDQAVESGDDQFEKLSEKVKDNLKSISEFVKKANFSKESQEFKYDPDTMNQMFSKSSGSEVQSKAKRFEEKFAKTNKRRSTNSVTRSKNNKSFTFKKTN